MNINNTNNKKNFKTKRKVKWCPGCGNYSILKQLHTVFQDLKIKKENIVIISGIGCSSRTPYYIDTYGIHGIHGRAISIATGVKLANPNLSVWITTGDGDCLSIGTNHLIHILRRNLDVNILLFNNEIYGLTKGQYSPTSVLGLKTKSSPLGTIDQQINPLSLVLGSQGTFVARSIDVNPQHLRDLLFKSFNHLGTSFLEIYQNCNIFNDNAFKFFVKKENRDDYTLFLKHGEPLIFGKKNSKGIILDGLTPKIVNINEKKYSLDELWIHDEEDRTKAEILTRFFNSKKFIFPRPFGVFYKERRKNYNLEFKKTQENINFNKKNNKFLNDLLINEL